MPLVAAPRRIVPKSKFRVEIDGIDDLRATTMSALKITFNIIDTEEGGAQTVAEQTSNGYKYEPITVERPLTEDGSLADWVDAFKDGTQDKRNGTIYALDAAGNDMYRWPLEEILIRSYEEFQGDAKGKEESMMERIELGYRERGKRVLI